MSFGYGVGDILAISGLAVKVYTAYKDAPDDFRNISDEVKSLHIIINKAAQHFESTTISTSTRQEGQEVLKGCQNVLADLDSLIEKYNSLASTNNKGQVLQRIKLGTEDIATLRVRLISNTGLLNGFIQSCEFHKLDIMQARLDNVLGLRRTTSRDSIISFAGSINTKKAYKKFCKGLFDIGVTADMISQKEKEIQDIFKPQHPDDSKQVDGSTSVDQSQLPEMGSSSGAETSPTITVSTEMGPKSRSRFGSIRPPIDFLVGPLMLAAAEAGNTRRFISTLEYVRNINFENGQKETALRKAAAGGHNSIVRLLLTKGASIEIPDSDNNTPLHAAAWNGHTSTVELLLAKGASVEALNKVNDTPLLLAAWNGHTNAVELLLMKGASIQVLNRDGSTALHLAAQVGHTRTAELLLMKGASIEVMNSNGSTPLHAAAWNGHSGTVELLLAKGALIQVLNIDGNTPLHLAAGTGHTITVELLLAKGAWIEALNRGHNTPLHVAAWKGHTNAVELLLMKGASVEALNGDGDTPLHLAAREGHSSTVKLLLMKGAWIEARNSNNDNPLHLAVWYGHTSTVELLLAKGASTQVPNTIGDTPLHLAARKGHTNAVELLLAKGASIEALNENYDTPLHLATRHGTVKLLENKAAELGILVDIRTVSG